MTEKEKAMSEFLDAVTTGTMMICRVLTPGEDGESPADIAYRAMQKVRDESHRVMESLKGLPREELKLKMKEAEMTLPLRELAAIVAVAGIGILTLKGTTMPDDVDNAPPQPQGRKPDVH
jgi:hypothetical protein